MDTKLKKLLKKRKMTQSTLYNKIAKKYETPVGQYALSEIVNGKKLNYHLITLVKICDVLKIKPNTIVESEELIQQLLKLKEENIIIAKKEKSDFTDEQEFITRKNNDYEF
jgi:transcriptional regulator with XRE-family HTH domain